MNRNEEMAVKVERLREMLRAASLEGVLLQDRGNFAWLTAGGRSFVNTASEAGVGAMLITSGGLTLLADNIEAARFAEEELAGLDVDVAEYPWHDGAARRRIVEKRVGSDRWDSDLANPELAGRIRARRHPLTDAEIDRYRAHGRASTELTEQICRRIERGMTENHVLAMTQEAFARTGVRVPVCLVAADDRIDTRRHPIPLGAAIRRRVMLVVCAESEGLWINLTRLVNFEPVDDALKIKHRAVGQIDATANAATRPGRTLGEIFDLITAEYDRQGFGDEWRYHHQGGSTGYAGRDDFAVPGSAVGVVAGQAFAWNPSITGTKSEDTILVGEDGFEFLTEPGADWPAMEIERDGRPMRRADILVAGG